MAVVLTMFIAGPSISQSFETDAISKAKVSELGFIVGDCKGMGLSLYGPGPEANKTAYEHTEKDRVKLDSTAILLEDRYVFSGHRKRGVKGKSGSESEDRDGRGI